MRGSIDLREEPCTAGALFGKVVRQAVAVLGGVGRNWIQSERGEAGMWKGSGGFHVSGFTPPLPTSPRVSRKYI